MDWLMGEIPAGGNFGPALNALYGAYTPLQNARANSVSLLAPALADYTSARSTTLSLLGDFDGSAAARRETTGIAGSYQLAQTSYAIAASRLTSALDTTSAA